MMLVPSTCKMAHMQQNSVSLCIDYDGTISGVIVANQQFYCRVRSCDSHQLSVCGQRKIFLNVVMMEYWVLDVYSVIDFGSYWATLEICYKVCYVSNDENI